MSYNQGIHKVSIILLLLGILLFSIQPPALGASTGQGDIQIHNRLDTVPEHENDKTNPDSGVNGSINVPEKSHTGIGDLLVGIQTGGKWVISNISDLASTVWGNIASSWNHLPDWARGLLKGFAAGLIAAAIILLLAAFGVIGLAAALVGAVVAVLAGIVYGLWVGGNDFKWLHGISIALAAGGVAAFIFEVFGVAIVKGIHAMITFLNKFSWLKSAVRPFTVGGIINLGSYLHGHSSSGYTIWGIVGSFIIGGLCGVLYGELLLPWLQEARYLIVLRRYVWLMPLARLMNNRMGSFIVYNVFGGGLLGALTTVLQNSFIGEPTTFPGLMAGMVAGFLAATVITSPFKGLARTLMKRYISDILENGLLEFLKFKLQNFLERIKNNKTEKKLKARL